MRRILLYAILTSFSIGAIHAFPIEQEGLKLHSMVLKREVRYSVILPEGYEQGTREYPVLYMFHGIGGDETSWLEYGNVAWTMDRMVKAGSIKPFIIVIPNGYLSYYSDAYDGSFSYETFFIKEFIPFIDQNYRTQKFTASRSVIGFSMGGFGALSICLRHRDLFGSVIALSPSIRTDKQYVEEGPQGDWDQQWGRIFGGIRMGGSQRLTEYYKERSPYHILSHCPAVDLKSFGIMIDIGDKEGSLCESNEELHKLLLQRGVSHEWEVRSGGHDFLCWNAALPKAFCFANRYFNNRKETDVEQKYVANDNAPVRVLPDITAYYPKQAATAQRKYPIIYIQGDISQQQQQQLVSRFRQMVSENKTWPAILCFVRTGKDLLSSISDVESSFSEIRTTQRMRALITVGNDINQCIRSMQHENLFTGIVCVNSEANEDEAYTFVKTIRLYERYPRCWIEVNSEFKKYVFSSRIHILLRELGVNHEFRSRDCRDNYELFSHWEEWLLYLNQRIHV